MTTSRSWRALLAAVCGVALVSLTLTAAGATAAETGGATAAASGSGAAPIVTTTYGAVRGTAGPGGDAFLGLPYAAPPTGNLRWRPPQPPAHWRGVRDAFAAKVGCPDQTAACLRRLPVADLVSSPFVGIPGVVDGQVLTEPIGTALAAGRFARVPVLDGTNHDEERIFVSYGRAISGGTSVAIPGDGTVTAGNYQTDIAAVLAVPAARAAAIAAQYPPADYPSAAVAFSTLVGDASFACPALQLDSLTAKRVPTFAYEFNDDAAPLRFTPPLAGPPVATHGSELQYLFELPNAPVPGTLNAGQQALAASMRTAWANFAASGNPATTAVPWPAFGHADRASVLSLVPPQPQLETDFAPTTGLLLRHGRIQDAGLQGAYSRTPGPRRPAGPCSRGRERGARHPG